MSSSQPTPASESVFNGSSRKVTDEVVTRASTVLKGNTSSDNSIMITGPVAGKIIYCENYVICSSRCRASKTTTNTKHTVKTPGTVSQTPVTNVGLPVSGTEAKVGSELKHIASRAGTGEIQGDNSSLPMPPAQYVSFYSDASDRPKKVYAICRPDIKDNWISLRVVNRLNLKSRPHTSMKEAVFDGKPLTSTGRFVQFACSEKQSREGFRCRLYIAKHPDFDILFGSEFASSTATLLARDGTASRSLPSSGKT